MSTFVELATLKVHLLPYLGIYPFDLRVHPRLVALDGCKRTGRYLCFGQTGVTSLIDTSRSRV